MEKMVIPQNVEAERGILSCILLDPASITRIADRLRSQDFYVEKHRVLYEAMLALDLAHKVIDTITLHGEIEQRGCLGLFDSFHVEVGGFYNCELTSDGIEDYAESVHLMSQLREAITLAQEIAHDAYRHDPQTIIRAEERLSRISQGKALQRVVSIQSASDQFVGNLMTLYERKQRNIVTGIPTGFVMLDRVLGGLQPSDSIVLAARPAVGKTSFALGIAHQVMGSSLKAGKKTLMFSLEMALEQLMRRLYSMETGIDQTRLRTGDLNQDEWDVVMEAHKRFSAGQMWLDETPGLSLADLRSRARRTQSQHGLDLVIVDYMQLMKATLDNGRLAENRVQEVSMISRGLKELARELNVPVLSLAQLSRAVENRQDKTPQLSDLRESGTIEQDADIVMFLHRDPQMQNILNVIVAKHRNGPTGIIPLHFTPHLTRFEDVTYQYQEVAS